jgi:hypothetical protein
MAQQRQRYLPVKNGAFSKQSFDSDGFVFYGLTTMNNYKIKNKNGLQIFS